jgi:hypothetical protein
MKFTFFEPVSLLTLGLLSLPALGLADGAFYGDPPDATHAWAIHDMNRAQPPRVEPGTFSSQEQPGKPPSDAIVLFDGSAAAIANWEADKTPAEPTKWEVKDSVFQCVPGSGYVRTKEQFSDCQLHIEWSAPSEVKGDSQGRGNSGIFLMGQVEVQVLDNYNNPTYPDGFAGSIYGINPPMANPLRAPGEWQVYDIVFRRPLFKDGQQIDPGYLTVFVNGLLVQDHTPIDGGGGHRARSKPRAFPDQGPLKLQDHGNPVRYRNIWYRPLPKRALDGGDTSVMSPEATQAKRQQIAQSIREDAAKKEGVEQMLRLLESLCYAPDSSAWQQVISHAEQFGKSIAAIPADKIEAKKGEIMHVNGALQYMVKFNLLPGELPLAAQLAAIVKEREWDKKK